MTTPRALTPLDLAFIAFGAVVLGHALEIRDGFYDVVALRWALLAAVCVLAGTARLGGRSMSSEPVESCIINHVRRWMFPSPQGNGTVQVTYPYVFKPSGQ